VGGRATRSSIAARYATVQAEDCAGHEVCLDHVDDGIGDLFGCSQPPQGRGLGQTFHDRLRVMTSQQALGRDEPRRDAVDSYVWGKIECELPGEVDDAGLGGPVGAATPANADQAGIGCP
jgi:hypothetical protein